MIESATYYLQLFLSVCGFEGNTPGNIFALLLIITDLTIVIAAFYFAVSHIIWPGEENSSHIKYQILDDESASENNHAN